MQNGRFTAVNTTITVAHAVVDTGCVKRYNMGRILAFNTATNVRFRIG